MSEHALMLMSCVAMMLSPLVAAFALRDRAPRPPQHTTGSIRCADTPKLPRAWARKNGAGHGP